MKLQKTAIVLILLGWATQPALADKNVQPDYTKGEKFRGGRGSNWTLGPTGMTGWFWTVKKLNVTQTRQILINGSTDKQHAVAKGSPADGLIFEQDVILGVGDGKFTSDPRKELANAITEAEKKENGGKLTLNIWRPETDLEKIVYKGKGASAPEKRGWPIHKRVLKKPVIGKTMQVTLTLPVMGTYSETSPWECPKTKLIIDNAGEHLLKNGLGGGIPGNMNALGLLATGEEKYLPIIREYAHKVGDPNKVYSIGPDGKKGSGSWTSAYLNLFLTEYYLATKDEYVLPHIKSLSNYIALGRSGVGTWSHGMADVKKNGFFGPASAYGAMNQISITCAMSLVLAQQCDIKDEAVDEAIEKAVHFLRWYVDKGTIPYGDHAPALNHDNNGRNAQTAVLFALYGDKHAADYFTRMAIASYPTIEVGHTGHFFSLLWSGQGAARGGPEAASSFIKNTRYFTELERHADGSFVYQNQLGGKGDRYPNWDTTGCRLLRFCLPRRKLYITCKGGSTVDPITGDDLKTVVAAATFDPKKLSVPELLEALGNWSVVVRQDAAQELGRRKENVTKELVAMLDSPNRYARYGACIGLQYAGRGSEEAVKALIDKLENSPDINLRYFAIEGLKYKKGYKNGLKEAVKKAGPALFKLAANFDAKQDPYGKLSQKIVTVLLFSGRRSPDEGYYPGGKGMEKVDSDLVVNAMKAWLKNPNGAARTLASSAYENLTQAQLDKIWGEVYYAAKNKAPSGVMFSGGGKANSTILLSKQRFKEGLPLAVDYLKEDGWGKFGRVPAAFEALSYYGSAVKPYMPIMQAEYDQFSGRKGRAKRAAVKHWANVQKNLDKEYLLRSIEPYLKEESAKDKN